MATITWTSAVSGNWNTASNWSGGLVPGAADDAVISVPGAYLISVPDVTVHSVTLTDAAAELMDIGTLKVTGGMVINAGTLNNTGNASLADLSISNSGTVIGNGLLNMTISDPRTLERIGGSGQLTVAATFNNFGTADLVSLGSLNRIDWEGTIAGGTLLDMTGEITNSLTLANAKIGGTLDVVSEPSATLVVNDGVTFTGADGTGAASVFLEGHFNPLGGPAIIQFNGDQTLQSANIVSAGGLIQVPDTLTIGSGAIIHAIPIPHSSSGQLTGVGNVINNGTINIQASGFQIDVANFANSGSIEVTPNPPPQPFGGELGISSQVFNNLVTGSIEVTGGEIFVGANILTNAGMIATSNSGNSIIFGQGTVSNLAGGIIQSSGGKISFAVPVDLINDGTIGAAGGYVEIDALLSGSGIVTLQTGGTVEISNATDRSANFDFIDNGTLVLDQPTFVPATITNFSPIDTIRLGIAASAISYTSGDLKMQTIGGQTFDLGVTGSHNFADFIIENDSISTLINLACFAAGTRIQTTRGMVPVEQLRQGDPVVLANAERALPVVWVGYRTVECRRHPKPASVWPVRIAAGAFARNVPRRNLYLSPDHAIFVDGVLIPIRYLINGTTIASVRRNSITYYHVELSCHAVLLAEGLPSESRLPTLDRSAFANGGGPIVLHPDFHSHAWEAEGCAPLVVTGPPLADVRARLDRRAFDRPSRRRA